MSWTREPPREPEATESIRGPTFIMLPSSQVRELRIPVKWVDVDEMLLHVAQWPTPIQPPEETK